MTIHIGPLVVMCRDAHDRLVSSRGSSLGEVAWLRRRVGQLAVESQRASDREWGAKAIYQSAACDLRAEIERLKGEVNDLTAWLEVESERAMLADMERGLDE